MINEKEKKVYDVLYNLNIKYKKYEHVPVFTIEEANELNIDIHPNVNNATIELSLEDFDKYLQWCGNKVVYVQI